MGPEELRDKLERLRRERLVDELLTIADGEPAVRLRLETLALATDPEALGKSLENRISRLMRARRFVPHRNSATYARELDELVETVERDLLPYAPEKACELAELFLRTDGTTFERVDDSSGWIASAYRRAARLWLDAAAASSETPADSPSWMEKLHELAVQDAYGVRMPLLRHADVLLSEHELRRLVRRFEGELSNREGDGDTTSSLALLAEALRDPRLFERSITCRSGVLSEAEAASAGRRYLEWNKVADACRVLQPYAGPSARREVVALLAECHERTGDVEAERPYRWQLFEAQPDSSTLERLLELETGQVEGNGGTLSTGQTLRARAATERARRIAAEHPDVIAASRFLLEAGFGDDAESLLLDRRLDLEEIGQSVLAELARLGRAKKRPTVEVVIYRELTVRILDATRRGAYGHAAHYLGRLEELDESVIDYGPLDDHAGFRSDLKARHGRKSSFWRKVGRDPVA